MRTISEASEADAFATHVQYFPSLEHSVRTLVLSICIIAYYRALTDTFAYAYV